jgi:hypothetical protein
MYSNIKSQKEQKQITLYAIPEEIILWTVIIMQKAIDWYFMKM